MKKIYIFLALIIIIFSSCEKVLDKERLDSLSDVDVWNNTSLAERYLNNLYKESLPDFGGTANTSLCEETQGSGFGLMMYGQLTTDADYGSYSPGTYVKIRKINVLTNNIDNGSIETNNRRKIKGQALFLRAWLYWQMVLYYGGVPLVMEVQDPIANPEGLKIPRSSAKECIKAIVTDLDSSIASLPASWPGEYGRITRGAAAALKGRVLLFWASPQFNPGNLAERWNTAYDANKKAKEICDADGNGLHSKFSRIFLDEGNTNKEAIFVKVYDQTNYTHTYDGNVRPRSESSSGGQTNNPTWEMVKAFPMKNGLAITDPASGYDSTYFWKDRDPRFYTTIAWNGCIWGLSNKVNRRQWAYNLNNEEKASMTRTGFYCRKNIDTTRLADVVVTGGTGTDWIEIRYAEVLLNLAEAAAEKGLLDEAKEYVKLIRARAGILSGDGSYGITASSSEEMVALIMKERQVEFAYENKRHWDMRRRNMYINNLGSSPKFNGTRRHKMFVMLDTAYIRSNFAPTLKTEAAIVKFFEDNMRDTINWNKNYFKYFIHRILEAETIDINYLQPKYNFYFISPTQVMYQPYLKQTINWADADYFDPLAE